MIMKKLLKNLLAIVGLVFVHSVSAQCPVITCPTDITVNNDPGTCGAIVNYTTPVGTDACAPIGSGNILVVSDVAGATEIAPILSNAGFTVTNVINDFSGGNNTVLQGSLSSYDAIYWHAVGAGAGDVHNAATFTNLTNYVNSGGAVFVHGYDVIASPTDQELINFLGGTSSVNFPGNGGLGTIAGPANSITDGYANIVGLTLNNSGDHDALVSLTAGTVGVAPNSAGWDWTLRTLGAGEIAWVSTGQSTNAFPQWSTVGSGYAEALLNFAVNSTCNSLGNILVVSDATGATEIAPILTNEGYNVTVVNNDFSGGNNTVLQGSLSSYDVIFWQAIGTGFGDIHNAATFTNLTNYVNSGGAVFVHGYDVIASPTDQELINFLGGTSSTDVPTNGGLGTLVGPANSLTDGVTNIVGLTLNNSGDHDALVNLTAGTVGVAPNASGWDWTLRSMGAGEIAWVSTGQNTGAFPQWSTSGSGYAEALLNFAYNHAGCGITGAPITALLTGLPDGGTFPVGVTTVSYVVTDYLGNNPDTCSFTVTVLDTETPVPSVANLSDVTIDCGTTPPSPTAIDNCGTIAGTANVTFPLASVGTTVVTWTYDDGSGNTTSQVQNVIVNDISAPVPDTNILEGMVECYSAMPNTPTATDACEGTVVGVPDVSLPLTTLGLTTITWTFTDGYGNSSTQIQNIIVNGSDLGVTQNGAVLTADDSNADYQWVDCDNGFSLINGAINQSFTPSATGNYAVILTENGCVDTSACILVDFTSLAEVNIVEIQLYPNPNSGTFTLVMPGHTFNRVQVFDNSGRLVHELSGLKTEKTIIDLPALSPGSYNVKATGEKGVAVKWFVVN